jgi:hypothetical protein
MDVHPAEDEALMMVRRRLEDVTIDDVFDEFIHGDDALRRAFAAWLAVEPLLSPASMEIDLAGHRAFYRERMKPSSVARIHRVIAMPFEHWLVDRVLVGRHWSLSADKSAVMSGRQPPGSREYLLTAEVDLADPENIDWAATIAAREAFQDQEDEITLRSGRPLRLTGIEDPTSSIMINLPSEATTDGPPRDEIRSFVPCIHGEAENRLYDDGRVYGTVTEFTEPDGRKGIAILEWTSRHPGNGHTTEALSWLRQRYDAISANGIGSFDEEGIGDISIHYWERMREKGLADKLLLDDGIEYLPELSASMNYNTR